MDAHLVLPDWRREQDYRALHRAMPEAFAWEWLRRDPYYCAAAAQAGARGRAASPNAPSRQPGGSGASSGDVGFLDREKANPRSGDAWPGNARPGETGPRDTAQGDRTRPRVLEAEPAAHRWGLHAFADPRLPANAARPVWRHDWLRRVLTVDASAGGPAGECFDLARFAGFATVVCVARVREHVLLCDGKACLRIDVASGSLLAGPACLSYRLAGLAALRGPLQTLHGLVRLWHSGRLPPPVANHRARRLVLLLRAWDGLRQGASQRDIAAVLLRGEAAAARWRSEAPSLRTRAQRLAKGARAMAEGGYRDLLAR